MVCVYICVWPLNDANIEFGFVESAMRRCEAPNTKCNLHSNTHLFRWLATDFHLECICPNGDFPFFSLERIIYHWLRFFGSQVLYNADNLSCVLAKQPHSAPLSDTNLSINAIVKSDDDKHEIGIRHPFVQQPAAFTMTMTMTTATTTVKFLLLVIFLVECRTSNDRFNRKQFNLHIKFVSTMRNKWVLCRILSFRFAWHREGTDISVALFLMSKIFTDMFRVRDVPLKKVVSDW